MRKAIFLDRDGIINIDKNYVYKINDFEFNNDIFNILNYLQELDYLLFIITNQSGIGRGYYKEEDFVVLNNWMLDKFNENKIKITHVEYCPHHPNDNCSCRKPKTGMIDNILSNYDINLKDSWLIGDNLSDIDCARNAGVGKSIKINNKTKIVYSSENYFECQNIGLIYKIITK